MGFLHTAKSGWFPSCGLSQEPKHGPDTIYPVGVPLKKAMQWWWLVKTWKLTFNWSLLETSNAGRYRRSSQPTGYKINEDYSNDLMTPMSMICKESREFSFSALGKSYQNDYGNGEVVVSYTTNYTFSYYNTFWKDEKGLIWPEINVKGFFDVNQKGAPKVQAQLDPVAKFIVDGISIPIHVNWIPAWVNESMWKAVGPLEIYLNPVYF